MEIAPKKKKKEKNMYALIPQGSVRWWLHIHMQGMATEIWYGGSQ